MSLWCQPRIACKEGQAGPDNQKCGERQDTSKARRQKPYVGRAMPSDSILTICRLGTVPSLGWPIRRFWSTFCHFWRKHSKTHNQPGSSVSSPNWGGSHFFPRRNLHEFWVIVTEKKQNYWKTKLKKTVDPPQFSELTEFGGGNCDLVTFWWNLTIGALNVPFRRFFVSFLIYPP